VSLVLDEVTKDYPGGVRALDGVCLAVGDGELVGVVGPSGSGKSTLLRCLNRLVEPTAGRVRFDGRDFRSLDPRELRRRAALVMQTPVLFEGSVRDNLLVRPPGASGDFSPARLASALVDVGLDPELLDRDAATLSGGEKQRVTIARALLGNPQALLLDEPTSALDPPNVALVAETVSRLRERYQLTIVAVTHQPDLVRRLGGCLLYLVRGEVVAYARADGTVSDSKLHASLSGAQASPPIRYP